LWLGAGASAPWVLALIAAILLYDAIHKTTPLAVIVMGACRAGVYLVAASAAVGDADFSGLPPVFWVLLGAVWAFVAGCRDHDGGQNRAHRYRRRDGCPWRAVAARADLRPCDCPYADRVVGTGALGALYRGDHGSGRMAGMVGTAIATFQTAVSGHVARGHDID